MDILVKPYQTEKGKHNRNKIDSLELKGQDFGDGNVGENITIKTPKNNEIKCK